MLPINNMWVEKYRPVTLEDYVWIDSEQRRIVESWIANQEIPHLLLSGGPGVGKTTLAKLLFRELKVHNGDINYTNASLITGIENMRKLVSFCETMPNGRFRYVFLDEADRLSPNAQDALKNMIEEYGATCRWILTTNRPNKITPPLHSRTMGFHVDSLDREQFTTRIATILISENIDLNEENLDILEEYVAVTYPDLRRCINLLQKNCEDGKLRRPSTRSGQEMGEYMIEAVAMFKAGRISDGRKIVCANASDGDYEEIYRLLYNNLSWWGDDDDRQNRAIVIIANRLKDHSLVADPEINMAACLVELSLL